MPDEETDTNTSGHGILAEVPPEIDRWNWGSFTYGWLWVLNYDFPAPVKKKIIRQSIWNPFYIFYLGRKGNSLLWKYIKWESMESFQNHMQRESRVVKAHFLYIFIFTFVFISILIFMALVVLR